MFDNKYDKCCDLILKELNAHEAVFEQPGADKRDGGYRSDELFKRLNIEKKDGELALAELERCGFVSLADSVSKTNRPIKIVAIKEDGSIFISRTSFVKDERRKMVHKWLPNWVAIATTIIALVSIIVNYTDSSLVKNEQLKQAQQIEKRLRYFEAAMTYKMDSILRNYTPPQPVVKNDAANR